MKINNGAVTNSKIADFAITNGKLGNGEIDNIKIADNAITNGKIKNGEINSEKIGDGTIATADIADGAVTTAKISINASLSMNSNKITNLSDPTSNQDAATKKYVDNEIATATKNQVSSAFAWGLVSKTGSVSGSNVASSSNNGSGTYTVNFSTAATNSNYAVTIQQVGNGASGNTDEFCFFTIGSKSTGSFTINSARLNGDGICSTAFDFVVFNQ